MKAAVMELVIGWRIPRCVDQTRAGMMARWRHAVELAMTDEAIGKLTEISRSRTEAASRVARAQMLLRYAEKPSFYAVGRRLGAGFATGAGRPCYLRAGS